MSAQEHLKNFIGQMIISNATLAGQVDELAEQVAVLKVCVEEWETKYGVVPDDTNTSE